MQRRAIVEDVLRLLHLYEKRGVMSLHKGAALMESSSLNWRLSMALELVACPSLLVVDCAPDSKLCTPCSHAQAHSLFFARRHIAHKRLLHLRNRMIMSLFDPCSAACHCSCMM